VPAILTFDLGTTNFKAALFDDAGTMLARVTTPTPVTSPHPGWCVIDPGVFDDTITSLAMQLRSQQPDRWSHTHAVCFATQTNSFLLLDEQDCPLTPIILWSDRRALELAEPLQQVAGDPNLRMQTGVPAVGPQFALAKLMWLRQHRPDVWAGARRVQLIGDRLAWRLAGRHVTEAGAAGLTACLDIHRLSWRTALLAQLDAEHLRLPTPLYAGTDLGELHPRASEALQLPARCRVAMGCLDQYAGAFAAGCVRPDAICETTGTVLATVAPSDTFDANLSVNVFQGPAGQPGRWWRMAFGSVSANLLDALQRDEQDAPTFAMLDAEAAATGDDDGGLRLDAAASVRADHPVFVNLQPHHTRGHRVRAIMQAVADALRDQLHDLGLGNTTQGVCALGGAARSRLWLDIKARTLGRPIVTLDCPEPTCLGAAMLVITATRKLRL
jgi:sugar (pentulose or hexulose) kinase